VYEVQICIGKSLQLVIFIAWHYISVYVVQTDNVGLCCKKSFERASDRRSSWEIEVTPSARAASSSTRDSNSSRATGLRGDAAKDPGAECASKIY